jgi:tRNA (guanine37-N1)-methyltransferase
VLTCGPVFAALQQVEAEGTSKPTRVLLTPQGERLTQPIVAELARAPWLILLCGHYEGFDERIREGIDAREISIGDYILSGGEPAAMVLIDTVVRLLPGALGDERSASEDSFASGGLEHPQYTRPRDFRGMTVPDVLLSGDHGKVAAWRAEQSLRRTRERRPDLLRAGGADSPVTG